MKKFRIGSKGFRKVGRVYDRFEGRELFEYPCKFIEDTDGCCHGNCRLAALREAGFPEVADRLEANWRAQDWLNNWGKMVYDPREHGAGKTPGNAARRKAAARMVAAMRKGKVDYASAVVGGCWAGAMMG